MSWEHWLMIAMVMVGCGLLLPTRRRLPQRGAEPRESDQLVSESSKTLSQLRDLQLELHEFQREIEGQCAVQGAALEALVAELKQERQRVECLLRESRRDWPRHRPVADEERDACWALLDAGYPVVEVAALRGLTEERLALLLSQWSSAGGEADSSAAQGSTSRAAA
jgi:hypothetical protein